MRGKLNPVFTRAMLLEDYLQQTLGSLQATGLYRRRRVRATPLGPGNVNAIVDFSSNDYLGLAGDLRLLEAGAQASLRYGSGSGGSALVGGYTEAHFELEQEIAKFFRYPAALLFSSGYLGNLGAITALVRRHDAVFMDRACHASLVDGAILSRARLYRYPHLDLNRLEALLQASRAPRKWVLTDGVFSMDGDIAPVPALAQLCRRHDAWLVVDDAHGLGVLGVHGGGVREHFGFDHTDVPVLIGTGGKALGVMGGFVAGSQSLVDMLIQTARTYIYDTALAPGVVSALRASLRLVPTETSRRDHLHELISYLRTRLAPLGVRLSASPTPIQPVIVGDVGVLMEVARKLRGNGCQVPAIRPPTVPSGSARLRISLTAAHRREHVDHLVAALEQSL